MKKIVAASGVQEVHVAAPVEVPSRMRYHNTRVFMGGELRPPEYMIAMTDAQRIRSFRRAVFQVR